MAMAEQIISSEMSKETVDFLKIQRALIEFAQHCLRSLSVATRITGRSSR